MPVRDVKDDARVAYRLPQPAEMSPDLLVSPVLPADERIGYRRRRTSGSGRSACRRRRVTGSIF